MLLTVCQHGGKWKDESPGCPAGACTDPSWKGHVHDMFGFSLFEAADQDVNSVWNHIEWDKARIPKIYKISFIGT